MQLEALTRGGKKNTSCHRTRPFRSRYLRSLLFQIPNHDKLNLLAKSSARLK